MGNLLLNDMKISRPTGKLFPPMPTPRGSNTRPLWYNKHNPFPPFLD